MWPGFHSSFPFISPQQPPRAHPNSGNTLSFPAFSTSPWCFRSKLPSLTEPQLNGILRFCIILSLISLAFTRVYELQAPCDFKITLKKASLWSDNVSHSAVQQAFQPGIDKRFNFSFFQTSFFFLNIIFFLTDHNGHRSSLPSIMKRHLKDKCHAWYGEFQRTDRIPVPGDQRSHHRKKVTYTQK